MDKVFLKKSGEFTHFELTNLNMTNKSISEILSVV